MNTMPCEMRDEDNIAEVEVEKLTAEEDLAIAEEDDNCFRMLLTMNIGFTHNMSPKLNLPTNEMINGVWDNRWNSMVNISAFVEMRFTFSNTT